MRHFLLSLALLALGLLAAHPAQAKAIAVEHNHGEFIRLSRDAKTVFVANTDIADVYLHSPKLVYVLGKKPGRTTLLVVDNQDQVMLSREIMVTHNLASLNQAITDLVPDAKVTAQTIQDSIVLTGNVKSQVEAENIRRLAAQYVGEGEEIINRIDITGPTQVHLRVKVAEVSRNVTKRLGIEWQSVATDGAIAFGLSSFNPLNFNGRIPRGIVGAQTFGLGANYANEGANISGMLDALAQDGLVTIMAEPNLTALSGETASFLAGGDFAIPVPQGNGAIGIEYQRYGVELYFTPTLLGGNRISMKVRPEVSQLSSTGSLQIAGTSVPGRIRRAAETTVELGSGQSFAIAGLLQNNSDQSINKFPFLGDLPILGQLFRSDRFQRNETELVILITPYLAAPVAPTALASPDMYYAPPNDLERLLWGRNNSKVVKDLPADQQLVAPIGFMFSDQRSSGASQ